MQAIQEKNDGLAREARQTSKAKDSEAKVRSLPVCRTCSWLAKVLTALTVLMVTHFPGVAGLIL